MITRFLASNDFLSLRASPPQRHKLLSTAGQPLVNAVRLLPSATSARLTAAPDNECSTYVPDVLECPLQSGTRPTRCPAYQTGSGQTLHRPTFVTSTSPTSCPTYATRFQTPFS